MTEMSPERFQVLVALVIFFGVMFGIVLVVVFKSLARSRQEAKKLLKESAPPDFLQPVPLSREETQPEPTPVLVSEPVRVQREELSPIEKPEPSGPRASDVSPYRETRSHFWGRFKTLFSSGSGADLEGLEEILYTSDLGPQTVERLLEGIEPVSKQGLEAVKLKLQEEFQHIFDEAQVQEPGEETLAHLQCSALPSVWMIVGINGAGKTTSIGKISAQLAQKGLKVMVAAGDTFRAAAGAQLKVWTDRAQVEIFHPEGVRDPSAVAFDAVTKAKARGYDVVLIDTAGRLHTQAPLMEELKKIKRVIAKVIPEAPHETLIVLDANNGQNALHQAREFHQALGLTGVILTKMDGTAKGGVVVGLAEELKIPIRLIGVGEKIQDLRAFSGREFIDSILGEA